MKGIECIELRKFITEYKQKNEKNEFKPVAVGKYGIRTRESIYSKELAKDYSKNKIIFKNTLTVGMGSRQIDIGILTDDVIYSVSPAYHTYKISGINADYLRYCLMCRNEDMFKRFVKRGSRQGKSIDLKRWLEYEIPVYDVCNQEKIVLKLNKVTNVISMRKQQLQKLDELIQARFVEMFGDPIINPFNWEKKRFDSICENLDSRRKPISSGDRVEGIYPYYGASGIVDYVEDYIFDEDILLVSEDGANLLMRSTPIAFSVSGKVWVNNHAHVVKFDEMSLQKYVEIYFSLIDISENITGSAQPKLNQAKLNAMMIPIPEKALLEQYCEFLKQIYKSKLVIKNLLQIYKHQIQM
ncbi:MAG: restriction endonuclease subunit S [Eubacterium sp.]|nr:MAG: restriction endonuclease subunit S [Clostridiales bacterium]PWM03925.1 MAG: restriction endonuclease subunit S [Clostridiales bacterium]